MDKCRKCGTGNMLGPSYQPASPGGSEHLRYTCSQCGRVEKTPCADAKENEDRRRAIGH
jgi:RNase P subunit RPR2